MGVDLRLLAGQIVGMFVVFVAALFLPAGTFAWASGWVYLALFFGFTVAISLWLLRNNPGLLQERMTGVGSRQQKAWDKVLLAVVAAMFFAWLVLMPLDAVRFQWSQVPFWLQAVGVLVLGCSFLLLFLTFRENPYLSPAVRVQEERGQTVVSTGPYGYVRHPMYSGFVLFAVGTPLVLGSWYGLLLSLALIAMVARRAVLEEDTLRQELTGYDAYMEHVKHRLVPGLW